MVKSKCLWNKRQQIVFCVLGRNPKRQGILLKDYFKLVNHLSKTCLFFTDQPENGGAYGSTVVRGGECTPRISSPPVCKPSQSDVSAV